MSAPGALAKEFLEQTDLPLSSMQAAILADHALSPDGARYNVPLAYRIDGPIDAGALEQALQTLVDRHEILRTVYPMSPDGPVQAITERLRLPLQRAALKDDAIDSRVHEDAAYRFDLEREPPIRCVLYSLAADRHLLTLTFHHVAVDGWSIRLLIDELTQLYSHNITGGFAALAEPALQYADWASWQQERCASSAVTEAITRAAARLDGVTPGLGWPTMAHRRAAMHAYAIPASLVARLETSARARGTTLYALLAAAYAILIGRLSGEQAIAFGAPAALRDRTEIESVVGCFVNTVPVRVDLAPGTTVGVLLGKMRQAIIAAIDDREAPFDAVTRTAMPLGAFFNFDDAPLAPPQFSRCRVTPVACDQGTAKFPLMLTMVRWGDEIRAAFDYDAAIFDPALVILLPGYFLRIAEALTVDDKTPVDSLDLLDDDGLARLLADACGPATSVPESTLDGLIRKSAEAFPDRPAIVAVDGSLTFGELIALSCSLADRLAAYGVSRGERVVVVMRRSAGLVPAMLGALTAGGCYLPLEPDQPDARLSELLADAAPRVVVTDAATQERLRTLVPDGTALLAWHNGAFHSAAGASETETPSRKSQPAGPDDLAYMIYTSGSTGRPKAVMVSHRAALNYLTWAVESYRVADGDGTAVVTASAFDATVLSFWAPLLAGRAVELLAEDGTIAQLAARLAGTAGYSFVKLTPAHLDLLTEFAAPEAQARGAATFVIGGEALTPAAVAPWRRRAPGLRLINEYGPTETVVGCCIHEVTDADADARAIPIGRPIANTRLYVLDKDLRPLAPGILGELFIGGAGVAQGYWQRPGQTAERFIADPFSPEPGARMYRSGDLARRRADGSLDYLGRRDDQVKIRGFRVELGEIEAALRAVPGVESCALLTDKEGGERRLFACVTGTATPEICRAALAAKLPGHMVPAEIALFDALPLTDNGKIDRAKLAAALAARAPTNGSDALSASPNIPAPLLDIWRNLLNGATVGPDSDFFAAGGTSLTAVRLIARLRREFGPHVPLDAVHRAPTPRAMARLLAAAKPVEAEPDSVVADQSPIASPGERQLWLESLIGGRGQGYVMQGAVVIAPPDAAKLRQAVRAVAARHPLLRTCYSGADDAPSIRLDNDAQPDVAFDSSGSELSEAAARVFIARDAETPFDLKTPPWRLRLVRLTDGQAVLAITMHHIISDAVSLEIVLGDIVAELNGAARPAPEKDYRVYAGERARRAATAMPDCLAYWRERLTDVPAALTLPNDRGVERGGEPRGAALSILLPADLVARAEAAARRHGATVHAAFCAAYALLLRRLTGAGDCVIGIPVSERPAGFERVVGMFLNTLPLRLRLDDIVARDDGGDAAIALAANGMRGLLTHAEATLARLVEDLKPPRLPGRPPLFQTVLDWNDAAPPADDCIAAFSLDVATAPVDLAVTLRRVADGSVRAGFVYDRSLFDPATIEAWARSYRRLLASLSEAEKLPIDRLTALESQDHGRVVIAGAPAAPEASVAALLRARFVQFADRIALDGPDGIMRYDALAAAAEKRAAQFGQGDPPIHIVATADALERVIEAVGALFAGRAFQLEDPNVPEARRKAMRAAAACWPYPMPCADNAPDAPAYVQFTSGSTGNPKGAIATRSGLANLAQSMASYLHISPGARVIQAATPSFDAWIWETFTTLAGGGTLVMRPRESLIPGPALAATLAECAITHATLTPSALAAMESCALPALRVLVSAGESLSAELAARWSVGRRLVNAYGPCETAICATAFEYLVDGSAPAIGTPIPGVEVMVMDRRGAPALPGAEGELWIAGVGVGLGYLGDARATAERFVAHPWRRGERAYRTGDIVRMRADGAIQFIGRDDRQVKVRGVRIELDEVEAKLTAIAGVTLAAARLVGDSAGRPALAAWISGPAAADPASVRAALAQHLPEAMLPAFVIPVAEMPMTATGKIDRNRLPDPQNLAAATAPVAAPAGPLETAIAESFREVLALDRQAGRNESFFVLGGHSLLAVRLAGMIARRLGREIPLALLFAHPTPADLAEALDASTESQAQFRTLRAGDGPEAILVHPVSGTGACYHALADAWPGARRIVALEQTAPFDGLDAMAEAYADAVAARVGTATVLLAGWSSGAMLAARMAARLRSDVRDVRVVLIDGAPTSTDDMAAGEDALAQAAQKAGADDDTVRRVRANITMFAQAFLAHQGGRAALIRARDNKRTLAADLGWGEIFDQVVTAQAAGDHATVLDADAPSLAQTIERLWRDDEAEAGNAAA